MDTGIVKAWYSGPAFPTGLVSPCPQPSLHAQAALTWVYVLECLRLLLASGLCHTVPFAWNTFCKPAGLTNATNPSGLSSDTLSLSCDIN